MTNQHTLPDDYRQIALIDIEHNHQQQLIVNGIGLLLVLLLSALGLWITQHAKSHPVLTLPFWPYFFWMLVVLALCAGWEVERLIFKELLIRHYSHKEVKRGICCLYGYACTNLYFNRKTWIIIQLAPVLFNGAALLILTMALTSLWAPAAYILQILNLAGSAMDLYFAARTLTMPEDILIHQDVLTVRIYSGSSELPA